MEEKPFVSIVIINYNGIKYLKNILIDCINSCISLDYANYEVLFIDNGSIDNSVNIINNSYGDKVKIIKLKDNYGTSKAKNIGIKLSQGEYVFLLNNDIVLPKSILNELINVMEYNENIGILGPKLIYPGGKVQSIGEYYGYYSSLLYLISIKLYNKKNLIKNNIENDVKYVDWFIGAATMLRKSIFKKIDNYDESFFMYHEEIDLALRLKKIGLKVACLTSSEVIHYENRTAIKFNKWKEELKARNELLFLTKNYSNFNLAYILLLYILRIVKDISICILSQNEVCKHIIPSLKSFSYAKKPANKPE